MNKKEFLINGLKIIKNLGYTVTNIIEIKDANLLKRKMIYKGFCGNVEFFIFEDSVKIDTVNEFIYFS